MGSGITEHRVDAQCLRSPMVVRYTAPAFSKDYLETATKIKIEKHECFDTTHIIPLKMFQLGCHQLAKNRRYVAVG